MNSCPQTYSLTNDLWTVLSAGPWTEPESAINNGFCIEHQLPCDGELALQVWPIVDADGQDRLYLKLSALAEHGLRWKDHQVGWVELPGEIREVVFGGEQAAPPLAEDSGEYSYAYRYDVTTSQGHYRLLVQVCWTPAATSTETPARFHVCFVAMPEW